MLNILFGFIIFLIVIAAFIFSMVMLFKWKKHHSEPFDAIKQLRDTQAQVDALDERDLDECPANADFSEVCRRHRACCVDNAVGADGCLCRHPILAKCRAEYNACQSTNNTGPGLNQTSTEFVGSKAAKGDLCQTILDNCCISAEKSYKTSGKTTALTMVGNSYKPIVAKDTNGPICSQVTDTSDECKYACASDSRCRVAYRDSVAGLCQLYSDPVIKKKNTNEMLAADSFQMWIRGSNGIKDVEVQEPDVVEGFRADLVSRCMNNTDVGDCQQPVIAECQRLQKRCINEYSELLGDNNAKTMCAKNHKACCQTLANVDLASRFALDGPTWGSIKQLNNKDNWSCDISRVVKSQKECQQRCLEDPRCRVLDSNMSIFKGIKGGMQLANMPAARCVMYDNNVNVLTGVNAGKKKQIGKQGIQILYEPDNIWKRRDIDELDAEVE